MVVQKNRTGLLTRPYFGRDLAACKAFTASIIILLACSCGGGFSSSAPSAERETETPIAAASPAATTTPDPLADAAPNAQRVFDEVQHLSVDIGPRVAGTPGEIAARDYIRSELESYGFLYGSGCAASLSFCSNTAAHRPD